MGAETKPFDVSLVILFSTSTFQNGIFFSELNNTKNVPEDRVHSRWSEGSRCPPGGRPRGSCLQRPLPWPVAVRGTACCACHWPPNVLPHSSPYSSEAGTRLPGVPSGDAPQAQGSLGHKCGAVFSPKSRRLEGKTVIIFGCGKTWINIKFTVVTILSWHHMPSVVQTSLLFPKLFRCPKQKLVNTYVWVLFNSYILVWY